MKTNTTPKIYLTLDLEKDYGTALKKEYFYALKNIEKLILFLEENNINLTVFIQTKILEEDILPNCLFSNNIEIEFGVHSYSHELRNNLSFSDDLKLSTTIYKKYFNKSPKGYRAPDGIIQKEDVEHLKKYGYIYDSTIFPTWRPRRFNQIMTQITPFYWQNGILEMPFSILNPLLPIPISLSYFKIMGKYFQKFCSSYLTPQRIIFDFHLHDFEPPLKSYQQLPSFYKIIYNRNFLKGFQIFKKFVHQNKKSGVIFDNLYNYVRELKRSKDF